MKPWMLFLLIAAMFNVAQFLTPFPTNLILFIPIVLFDSLALVAVLGEGRK